MKDKNKIPEDQNIIDLPIEAAMPENYLPYAVDVARDRALPDVRDGLKPVHRRILYGAYQLKAFPDRSYYKSARIVGDIMGKFHPHGDSSIYDAMSILAQDFSTRVPLIEGQGNWGSQDGDPAAAMRYTEARLSKAAMLLLKEIDMDTVDFIPNYSDTEEEPTILPSRFPNLLINGSFGIAVGLSTNIPPHNPVEALDAVCALIDNKEMTTKDLMKYIKGPDLPTGGIIIGGESLENAYETGEGKCILRAKTEVEKLDNGRLGIAITDFPYRKNKARILQTISEMTADRRHQKQLEAINEIRDESGRLGVRAVIEFKRNTTKEEAERVRLYLLKKTDLQSNLNFNMVAIDKGKPITFSLKAMLLAYIDHQREIVTRRTKKELENAEARFHIVEGFIKAIDVMDELIKTIRGSKNKQDALKNIMDQFKFTEKQSVAILELMLYRLTGLELNVFTDEHEKLVKTISSLKAILGNKKKLDAVIKKELNEVKEQIGDIRRTEIIKDEEEAAIDVEELVVIEDSMATISKEGFIKKVPMKSYNRSSSSPESVELREEDELISVIKTNTNDNLYLFTDLGNMYQVKSSKIPEMKWKDKGIRLDELIRTKTEDNETVVSVFSYQKFPDNSLVRFITDKGNLKRTLSETYDSKYTKIVAMKLQSDEKVLKVLIENGQEIIDNSLKSILPVVDNPTDNEKSNEKNNEKSSQGEILTSIPENDDIEELTVDNNGQMDIGNVKPDFLHIKTEKGLSFTIPDGVCEVKDKMVSPETLTTLPGKDRITSISYKKDYEVKDVNLILKNGKVYQNKDKKKLESNEIKVSSISTDNLLIVLNDGMALKLPSYLFEELSTSIDLNNLLDLQKDKYVVSIISLDDNFLIEKEMVIMTSGGLIKRMSFKEFSDLKGETTIVKLKSKEEQVVLAMEITSLEDIVLAVTKKAMGIKFTLNSISIVGRYAAGVVGISLKEEDEVLSAYLLNNNKDQKTSKEGTLQLTTNRGSTATYDLSKMKVQNRAGKGVRVMSLVLDETLRKVEVKNS